jgi:hypothetical protein
MTFLTGKALPRRTVLRGLGASLSLPLLDAMLPAWSLRARAATTAHRFLAFYVPNGMAMEYWTPKGEGRAFELSPILEPLAPFRQHLTIVSGLRNMPGETPEPHGHIEATWLSCVKPWDHGVSGPEAGVTADQMAARHIGQDTRLPSLELTTAQVGARVAWRTPTQSLPQEGNPRAVFQKLFGQGDTDAERAAILQETGSILDRVKGQAARLQASLGVGDRVVVSDYLDSVREIERRVQMASRQDTSSLDIPDAPVGTPNDITEHFALMFDLMALAFQADITRVITFSMDREASMRTYTNLGIAEGFHPLSHHGNNGQKMDKLVQIQRYHTEVFAKFVERLSKAQEAGGTVLDHSTILYGHKIFAPTGIGVVYGKRALLEAAPPWQGGGNMIADVTFERTIYQAPPARFEAGTGNIADAVGLGAALDYLERLGLENVSRYEHDLLEYGTRGLQTVPGLRLIGTAADKASVMSFVLAGYAPEEVGKALNQEGIAVRSGHHCAQPILRRFGVEATVRPSLAFYNTCEEIDVLVAALLRLSSARRPG